MAIKPLKTIKFPGLPDTYTVPQVDAVPTQGSTNAVSSGGVYNIQTALEKMGVEIDITDTIHFTQGGGVQYNYEGKITNSTTASFSGYVDVSKFDKIRLTMRLNVNSSSYGIAFYKEPNLSDGSFLGGVREKYGAEQASAEVRTIDIPENANYIRTTWIKNDQPHYSDYTFSCVGIINGRIGELEDNVSNLIDVCNPIESVRIPLYPCQFIGNAYKNASGTVSDKAYCITTIRPLIFGGSGKIKVYTTNPNLYFWYMTSVDTTLIRADESFTIDGNTELQFNILTLDNTPVKSSDLLDVYVMTSKDIYEQYIVDNYYNLLYTNRFNNYGTEIYRYGTYTTTEQLGFAQRSETKSRITVKPCLSNRDVLIVCGHNSTNNKLEILAGTISKTLTEGQWMLIPANTVFQVSFKSDSTSAGNSISTSSVYIVKGSIPMESITQYLSNFTITRADAAFLADDKVFMISRNNEQIYSVFADGAFVVSNESLDYDEGHANSCNYDNGYVYVSDWTDNTLIHVYSVDTENNTLTYVKDLTIPVSDRGRIEYFVQNEEKEIFFLGWQSGDSATDPNNLVYGLYVLTSDGYVLAWEKKALRPIILQGFTVQDNNFYMVENDTSYHTTAIFRLDLNTGLMNKDIVIGTLGTYEGEAIIPIDNRAFFIVDKNGRLYFKSIAV